MGPVEDELVPPLFNVKSKSSLASFDQPWRLPAVVPKLVFAMQAGRGKNHVNKEQILGIVILTAKTES